MKKLFILVVLSSTVIFSLYSQPVLAGNGIPAKESFSFHTLLSWIASFFHPQEKILVQQRDTKVLITSVPLKIASPTPTLIPTATLTPTIPPKPTQPIQEKSSLTGEAAIQAAIIEKIINYYAMRKQNASAEDIMK